MRAVKNSSFERLRRQARLYHRNRTRDQFEGGILVRHVYDDRDPERLSWWDDVQFIRGKMRVNVAWRHPRFAYQNLLEEAAWKSVWEAAPPTSGRAIDRLRDDSERIYKKVGRSRKKVSAYRLVHCPGEQERHDAYRVELARLNREAGFSVGTSFDVQQLNWCRFVEIVAPIEIRNVVELRALADLVRRILARETTLEQEFPGYVYGKAQWIADGLAEQAPPLVSHQVAGT